MISIVIPHKGRDSLLIKQLEQLQDQTHGNFSVIIVLDEQEPESMWYENHRALYACLSSTYLPVDVIFSGGGGPATARNKGVEHAHRDDVVLFLGSDCLPNRHLVAQHVGAHQFTDADIVQGYTPWHPDVVTPFYDFMDVSGLQAAWGNLKNPDGSWREKIDPMFFLTTNISIKRQLLLNEPFDESFSGAAWEDVELGFRLSRRGDVVARFNPTAINYHYHRYDLDSFLQRCRMEGYHRLSLAKIHPELAWNLVNPFELRLAADANLAEIVEWAKELDSVNLAKDDEETQMLKQIKYGRYKHACTVFSLTGVLDRIQDEHPAMQALQHVHHVERVIQIISGVRALDTGHLSYAQHCAEWYTADVPGDWSAFAFAGEVALACGDKEGAISNFRQSVIINNNEKWPKKRLEELT